MPGRAARQLCVTSKRAKWIFSEHHGPPVFPGGHGELEFSEHYHHALSVQGPTEMCTPFLRFLRYLFEPLVLWHFFHVFVPHLKRTAQVAKRY